MTCGMTCAARRVAIGARLDMGEARVERRAVGLREAHAEGREERLRRVELRREPLGTGDGFALAVGHHRDAERERRHRRSDGLGQ